MDKIQWDANPSRKLCEIELFKYEGYPLRVCTKPYGKYSLGAKKRLMKMAESMPECETKDSLIEILPQLLPPKELKIQQSCVIQERHMPRHDELLTNDHLSEIVRTLALNRMSTGEICKIVNGLDGNYNFSFDQMDKFLFRYWNTRADHGWTIHRQQEYEKFLINNYDLRKIFKFELENGFGHLAQSEVLINLWIATPIQWIDHVIGKTLQNINSSIDMLDPEYQYSPQRRFSADAVNEHKLRVLRVAMTKELSMMLNRFSKSRADFQKVEDYNNAELPEFRVHRKNTTGPTKTQNNYSNGSG
jgi:hypothetical protein